MYALWHKKSFKDGFLKLLSLKTLSEKIYLPMLTNDNFDCFSIEINHEFIGLIVIKKNCQKEGTFNLRELILPGLIILLRNPMYVFRFLNIIQRNYKIRKSVNLSDFSEIYIFYIKQDFQKLGLGLLSLQQLLNSKKYNNLIVETSSESALKLYKKVGFLELKINAKFRLQRTSVLILTEII